MCVFSFAAQPFDAKWDGVSAAPDKKTGDQ